MSRIHSALAVVLAILLFSSVLVGGASGFGDAQTIDQIGNTGGDGVFNVGGTTNIAETGQLAPIFRSTATPSETGGNASTQNSTSDNDAQPSQNETVDSDRFEPIVDETR